MAAGEGDIETVGEFFRAVRQAHGEDGLYDFAKKVGMSGQALGRVEKDEQLPGFDVLARIHPFIVAKNMSPTDLLLLWLEARELRAYAAEIRGQLEAAVKPRKREK